MLHAAHVEQLLTNMHEQIDTSMRSTMIQAPKTNAGANAQGVADRFAKKMSAQVKEELSWEKMKEVYVQVYGETFSQEEIDQSHRVLREPDREGVRRQAGT